MTEYNCPRIYESYKMKPFKVFVSHSRADDKIIEIVKEYLELEFSPYIAEINSIGKPLSLKLREELLDSDAMLIIWTDNAHENSREIISFETGMAWSNGVPIYIIKNKSTEIKWFYEQLTDYIELDLKEDDENFKENLIKGLNKLNFNEYNNPICFKVPNKGNSKNNSENSKVVSDDGTINLWGGFDGILEFVFGNHTNKIIRDLRITLKFPECIEIKFDSGDDKNVQRNEMFDMKQTAPGNIRVMWNVLPSEEHHGLELRLIVPEIEKEFVDNVHVRIQGGNYSKRDIDIPLRVHTNPPRQC